MSKSILYTVALAAPFIAAFAQDSVTVYGIVDAAATAARTGVGTVKLLDSGVGYGSRLGFRGTEDLGGGVKASFVLEQGIGVDTGAIRRPHSWALSAPPDAGRGRRDRRIGWPSGQPVHHLPIGGAGPHGRLRAVQAVLQGSAGDRASRMAVSKRSYLYTSYGRVSNNATSSLSLFSATTSVAPRAAGDDPRAISHGMRHVF